MKNNNIWLFITNEQNWHYIKDNNVYGFNKKMYVDKLKKGDKIIVYIKGKKIGGAFKIKNLKVDHKILFGYGNYPFQIKLDPIYVLNEPLVMDDKFSQMPDLTKKMVIFKNKKRWGCVLMGKSILGLPVEDHNLLKKLIKNEIQKSK